jgi:hypothetical protein
MQTAMILLAIGGDSVMQVPKFGVTPAEAMLLRAIHGDEAVTDIDINGEEDRSNREERERLFNLYAKAQPNGTFALPVLDALYPGVNARLPTKFSELELDEVFYKAQSRKTPEKVDPLDHDGDGEKGGSAPSAEEGYKAMTVPELKALAEERAIDLGGATKKADIIAKLEEADAAADADEGEQNLFQ